MPSCAAAVVSLQLFKVMDKKLLMALSSVCLIAAPARADKLIDFEGDPVDAAPSGWEFDGDSSTVRIAVTTASGDYPGGQAIRTDESGASYAGFSYPGPVITSIQADFLWDFSEIDRPTTTPTLAVYAWDDDDNDGFQAAERTIGFGLDNDGQFELSSEAGEISGTNNFVANTWYRLTMTWSEADPTGSRTVTLNAFDLTNSNDLGVVATSNLTAGDFGVAPSEWDGITFRMTRGTIDNIRVTSPGGAFTFVDATPENTTLNSDPENAPDGVPLVGGSNYINDGSAGSGSDDLWSYRTDAPFVNFEGGAAFESDNRNSLEDAELTADLITSVTLPVAGTYELVAIFTKSSNRDIAAGIGVPPGAAETFTDSNSLATNQAAGVLEIEFDDSFGNGRLGGSGAAYLGTVTTTFANESVPVFVNGLAATDANDDERTQYDGVGYRLTSASATASGLLALTYNPADGSSQVSIEGPPGVRYKLVSDTDLDFNSPDMDPVVLSGASVGMFDPGANEVVADASGNATVQFNLGVGQTRGFIWAVAVPEF